MRVTNLQVNTLIFIKNVYFVVSGSPIRVSTKRLKSLIGRLYYIFKKIFWRYKK